MRTLFFIGLIGVAAFMAGWFTISRDGEHTTIQFNRSEIRQDARRAIDRGREFLNEQDQQRGQAGDTLFTSRPDSAAPGGQQHYWPNQPNQPAGQGNWNNQYQRGYTPAQPASARPGQWQQPQQYPSAPAGYPPPPSQF